jgi:hypothetical protein
MGGFDSDTPGRCRSSFAYWASCCSSPSSSTAPNWSTSSDGTRLPSVSPTSFLAITPTIPSCRFTYAVSSFKRRRSGPGLEAAAELEEYAFSPLTIYLLQVILHQCVPRLLFMWTNTRTLARVPLWRKCGKRHRILGKPEIKRFWYQSLLRRGGKRKIAQSRNSTAHQRWSALLSNN